MSCFCDFNVRVVDEEKCKKTVDRLAKFGYQTVAISYKTELQGKDIPPASSSIIVDSSTSRAVTGHSSPLQQLTRITAVLKDPTQLYKFLGDSVKSYDLLAVRPVTEKLFHKACTDLEVDIISLDLTTRLPFLLRFPPVRSAIERGVHFEICYTPAILDATARRNVLANGMELARLTRGKNIIISSEAGEPMQVRGPYDVANLALLFGLDIASAKAAISKNCRAVLYHAKARGTGRSAVSIRPLHSPSSHPVRQLRKAARSSKDSLERQTSEDSNKAKDGKSISPVKLKSSNDSLEREPPKDSNNEDDSKPIGSVKLVNTCSAKSKLDGNEFDVQANHSLAGKRTHSSGDSCPQKKRMRE